MARDFDGSADYLEHTSGVPVNAPPFTMAAWFSIDTTTATGIILSLHKFSNGHRHILYCDTTADKVCVATAAATSGIATATASYSANSWSHAAGVWSASNSRTVYFNGGNNATNTTDLTPNTPDRLAVGAQRTAPSGAVATYFDGRIAEPAVWNVALSAGEIQALANGVSPLMIRPGALVFYAPLFGRGGASGDEDEWVQGMTLTQASSPALADHPRIIYPRRRSDIWVPAVTGYTHPTLSLATATEIGATSFKPRVTYTFA